MLSEIKLWRVYRKDIKQLPWYATEYVTTQCIVLAKTWQRAKGIAKSIHPSMFDDIAKADVLVEEILPDEERALN